MVYNRKSVFLKEMHRARVTPDDYIFANILHGYVKCRLPDEVATTQDVMSKLNYWPSTLATEHLLYAYADLGDGTSLLELLQESLAKTDVPFPPRVFADLYARLAMAPNFSENEAAAVELLSLLGQREQRFDDFRLGLPLGKLISSGNISAATNMLKATQPHNFSPRFLASFPELLVQGKQSHESLVRLWSASNSFPRIFELVRFMPTESMLMTLKCNLPIRPESLWNLSNFVVQHVVRLKDRERLLEVGEILAKQRPHLHYMLVVPRLLTMGLTPDEIFSYYQSPELTSSSALGCIIKELCPAIEFTSDSDSNISVTTLDEAKTLVSKFTLSNMLPFTGYLSFNSSPTLMLLRGALRHSIEEASSAGRTGHVSQDKLDDWLEVMLQCFPKERQPILAGALLRTCLEIPQPREAEPATSADQPASRRLFMDPQIRKDLTMGLSKFFSRKAHSLGLFASWDRSKFDVLAQHLRSGDMEGPLSEIRRLEKPVSGELSQVGFLKSPQQDLLDVALLTGIRVDAEKSQEQPSPTKTSQPAPFSSAQLEELFWALWHVSGLRRPGISVGRISQRYLEASDFANLLKFLDKVSEQASSLLALLKDTLSITSSVSLAHNFMSAQSEFEKNASSVSAGDAATSTVVPLGVKPAIHTVPITPKATKIWFLRKVTERKVPFGEISSASRRHIGQNFPTSLLKCCWDHTGGGRGRQIPAAYSLRDWAHQLGLSLLPQTSEVLAGSSVFVDSAPPIMEDQLNPQHLHLHSAVDLGLLSKLQEIAKLSPASTHKACTEVAQLLCDHTLIADMDRISQGIRPLHFKRLLFSFWSLVGQSLQIPHSCLADEASWNRIASSMINLAGPVGATAVLNWISCLLDPQRAASLMLAGLASENFKVCDQQHVLNLSNALKAEDSKGVLEALSGIQEAPENILSGIVTSQFSLLPATLRALAEKPVECRLALLNHIVQLTASQKLPVRSLFPVIFAMARPNVQESDQPDLACLRTRLSIPNQVYLKALFQTRGLPRHYMQGFASPVTFQRSILSNLDATDELSRLLRRRQSRDVVETLLSLKSSNPSSLHDVCSWAVYSYVLSAGNAQSLMSLLMTLSSHHDGTLLGTFAAPATPFLSNCLGFAFGSLAKHFRHLELTPAEAASISFYKLNEFLVPISSRHEVPASKSLSELGAKEKPQADTNDPMHLARESVTHLAETLISGKLPEETTASVIEAVRRIWGPGRVDLILGHLADLQGIGPIDQVVDSMPQDFKERRVPFRALSRLIKYHAMTAQERSASDLGYSSLVEDLRNSPPAHLALCMNGPHVSTLFDTWPKETLRDVLGIIDRTTGRTQTILRLQMAAALIHRNLLEEATSLQQITGPIPFNYLAGSLQHPLTREAFLSSADYMRRMDEVHLPNFVDATLRNAAIAARNGVENCVVDLVSAAVNDAHMDLHTSCQPATLRLLRECEKDNKELLDLISPESSPSSSSQKTMA
ncbi:unnamed protein product [Schistocephalus solidus]|uniref:Leucine-rich PPR motif-containing protein n=1 Tax=Schistocephalus solidus TaxID=70667 RepID=A0A183SJC1_SCHSO|nr:unnamed protein product [Schistocephalus solidus]